MKIRKELLTTIFFISSSLIVFSQCYPDRHSTNWYDGWISCDPFPSPNNARGLSHWIMYDFGKSYDLKLTHIWNVNDPAHLDRGLRNVQIDHSQNGVDWIAGGEFALDMATGLNNYEGFEGPDLTGINARYVLITAVDNWGGDCYGMSEIRFEALENQLTDIEEEIFADRCFSIELFPNPFTDQSRAIIQSSCSEKILFGITDVLGRVVDQGEFHTIAGFHTIDFTEKNLPAGNYLLTVRQGNQHLQKQLMKIE